MSEATWTPSLCYERRRLNVDVILSVTRGDVEASKINAKTPSAYGEEHFHSMTRSIQSALQDCFVQGWDGEEAASIKLAAIDQCAAFLTKLQDIDIHKPTVEPETDGSVTLDWYIKANNVLQISFDGQRVPTYVCLLDGIGHCGDVEIDREIGKPMRAIFAQIAATARARTDL